MPEAPRRRPWRRRPRIRILMVGVALVAVALGVIRAQRVARDRRVRLEQLRAGAAQAEAYMAWSRRMEKTGDAPASQAARAVSAWEKALAELKAFEGR